GVDGSFIGEFFAYDAAFTGGVYVAVGDVNGDGYADIITGAGEGGGPHVRVFSGKTLKEIASFFAFEPTFRGGVRVAVGDFNGDGLADIVTGAGPGGGPLVEIFDSKTWTAIRGLYAYDVGFSGGVYVAAGDVNGNGQTDIIPGAGEGGGPRLRVFDGDTLVV